ncbi:MAG TPA: hypothetical protein VFZ09_27625 [Archangium sp.]|uniref:hypothetical protein n=1 Tax=Archangium sp. TaxID=1872627 RepID=UPI002E355B20|nr:hypothetical protein [Archangium sp.]HEX5750031.1 hypothetical protein [Archangium sp.]
MAAPASAQEPFAFLAEVPTREKRRVARAHRPHLRGRTPPAGAPRQPLLPFNRARQEKLLTPELAESIEGALAVVRGPAANGRRQLQAKATGQRVKVDATRLSRQQRAAEATLLQLLVPFLRAEVEHAYTHHARTHLEKEDLLQEALARAQRLWVGFESGWAGPGKTLYPAYVMKAVRQHLGNVLEEAKLVRPTQWGRKLAARARRRVARESVSYEEALKTEGADQATSLGLQLGATLAGDREYLEHADERDEHREERAQQLAAVAALKRLPKLERLAVAVPMGLAREQLSDAQLARRLKCTLEELHAARARGLAALRNALQEAA